MMHSWNIRLWKKKISSKYSFKSLNFSLNTSLKLSVSFKVNQMTNLALFLGAEEDVSLWLIYA